MSPALAELAVMSQEEKEAMGLIKRFADLNTSDERRTRRKVARGEKMSDKEGSEKREGKRNMRREKTEERRTKRRKEDKSKEQKEKEGGGKKL